jgi:TPR repeat protein/GTPase SAR1 family protein
VDKHTLGNGFDFEQASRQWIMKNQSLKRNDVEPLFEDSKNRQDLQSFIVFPKQSSNSQASNPELKPSQKPEDNGICITIWDFAGQIKYHCMHQMFFRSNCLYLLVLDLQMDGSGRCSSEKEMLLDAQKWLNAIVASAGPEIGLIVVGSHADAFQSLDAAMDRLEDLMEKLEEMVPDVEYDNVLMLAKKAVVDNKKNVGISQLKSNLYETAERLLSDILVPLSWLRLLEKVREELPLKDNEICAPLENVQNLARTIGIMEKDQLCAALSFFDRVGELTYIRERELSEWVFTEPQLLLNAMKSLLVPERNLKKFLQRKQQRELKDYGFLDNEALKAIWTQYKNQEQLQHLMAAMGLIIEFLDGVAIPCRLPKKPTPEPCKDKPMEKEIVVTTKYSTRLPPSLYGHALAGLLRHHGTPGQGLRLLSQTTSCIEIDSSKLFLQNEQAQHTITLRAILESEQAQHAIALRVCASPASSHMPDETVLVDTLVRTVKVLVSTLHSLERDRFKWMTVKSWVQLHCCGNLREFQILESKRMSESDSAEIAPCQESFLCPAKIRHSLLDAVDVLSASQNATANVSQALEQLSDDIRRTLTCPISGDIMQDPVILFPSGKTFNRKSLCTWLLSNPTPRCPWTNVPLERHMTYVENRDTRETLIRYLGDEAYEPYNDFIFKLQYRALWNAPMFQEISALLYGMNRKQIDWVKAQEMAINIDQDDAIITGFKSHLLHPEIFLSTRLHKDEDSSQREWDRAEKLGLSVLADTGNPWAQWIKGIRLHIVVQDYDAAKSLYNLASEQELALAKFSLGNLYEEDDQFDIAQEYYEQASLQGHALAQYNLAMLYEDDLEVMIPYLEQAAAQEHASSLYYLSTLHIDADFVEQNLNRAREYLQRAAAQGHHEAQEALENLPQLRRLPTMTDDIRRILTCPISGDIMEDPVILFPSGKTFNRESLCTWLLRNPMPRCPWTNQPLERHMTYVENREIRDILISHLGEEAYVRYDDSTFKLQYQALWNTRLAPADAHPAPTEAPFNVVVFDAFSLFNAGVYYHDDDQFDIAEEYYERAASQGHAGAQYNVAMLNEDNHERMLGYLEQAAAQGHPDALYYLGTLYFNSDVVQQDLSRAQEYFQRATTQGSEEAREALRDI